MFCGSEVGNKTEMAHVVFSHMGGKNDSYYVSEAIRTHDCWLYCSGEACGQRQKDPVSTTVFQNGKFGL